MAHGFGANREMGLDPYARTFADAGFVVARALGVRQTEPAAQRHTPVRREPHVDAFCHGHLLCGTATAMARHLPRRATDVDATCPPACVSESWPA